MRIKPSGCASFVPHRDSIPRSRSIAGCFRSPGTWSAPNGPGSRNDPRSCPGCVPAAANRPAPRGSLPGNQRAVGSFSRIAPRNIRAFQHFSGPGFLDLSHAGDRVARPSRRPLGPAPIPYPSSMAANARCVMPVSCNGAQMRERSVNTWRYCCSWPCCSWASWWSRTVRSRSGRVDSFNHDAVRVGTRPSRGTPVGVP